MAGSGVGQVVARNRRARFDFAIEETLEVGLVLSGSEVKSLRAGRASITEAFAAERDGQVWLFDSYIPEYDPAGRFNHPPKRVRKLLLHRREVERLALAAKQKGVTLVPMSIYFNRRGIAKLELGLGTGKRKADKRETIKERDWKRDQSRLMRDRG